MASERGEYRAIRTVLLDGPDFQGLGERSRWVFVAMKLNFGPSGIEVHYPTALAHQLSAQTGIPAEAVAEAMEELEGAGWIVMESNVVWIVGQLEHDPSLNANDPKHRKSIQRHIAGLPRLEIVERFRGANAEWFTDAPEPLRRPSEAPAKALASTEDRRPNTEDRIPKTEIGREAPATPSTSLATTGSDDATEWRPAPPDQLPFAGLDWSGRTSGAAVLHEWAIRQPVSPSNRERSRYRQVCKRIADDHPVEHIALAIIGIGLIWPHAPPPTGKNEPWTPDDLDRRFAKALPAARDHPVFREQRFREALDNASNGGGW